VELKRRRRWSRPVYAAGRPAAGAGGSVWNWESEIVAAIAMVARDPRYRVVLCGSALTGCVLANLDEAAASAGVVLERRIRRGGGWDVMVRAA
jgi:hypothetical protein